jgi:phosphoribosylanthranilate isomerase
MIVQIYEIQTPNDAEKCIQLGVDHIGSVLLSQDEWRSQALKEVFLLTKRTDAKNSLIPLFKDMGTLCRSLDYYQPHFVHFCDSLTDNKGNETELEEFIRLQSSLKQKFPGIGIIRSIPIPRNGTSPNFPTLKIARELEPVSDIFLTDTWLGMEPVKGYIGITGKTADWEMARGLVLQSKIPVVLAGGLSAENVYNALMKVSPAGADSCTRTNRLDQEGKPIRFEKDFLKVEEFVKEIRRAEEAIHLKKQGLIVELNELKEELKEREASLPAHSVRPHQLIAIEELEEAIAAKEIEIKSM